MTLKERGYREDIKREDRERTLRERIGRGH